MISGDKRKKKKESKQRHKLLNQKSPQTNNSCSYDLSMKTENSLTEFIPKTLSNFNAKISYYTRAGHFCLKSNYRLVRTLATIGQFSEGL